MQITSGQYFKSLSGLCYALIGGMVLFMVIAVVATLNGVQLEGGRANLSDVHAPNSVFYIVLAVFVLGGITGSFNLFKKKLTAAKQKASLSEKLQDYRAAIIIRYALLEGPGLFSIIVYFIIGEMTVLTATVVIILLMVYARPDRDKLINDLELSSGEAAIINDPNSIVG